MNNRHCVIIFLFLYINLIFGCSTSKTSPPGDSTKEVQKSEIDSESVGFTQKQEPAPKQLSIKLTGDKLVIYREQESGLYKPSITVKSGQKVTILNNNYPSLPVVSPDKNKIAYISPAEWEDLGKVFIYNAVTGQNELAMGRKIIPDQKTPKVLAWLDNRYLLCIIGYAYGTITVGGDLYLLDTSSKKLSLIKKNDGPRQEIKDLKVDAKGVTIFIANFNEKMDSYKISQKIITREQILR